MLSVFLKMIFVIVVCCVLAYHTTSLAAIYSFKMNRKFILKKKLLTKQEAHRKKKGHEESKKSCSPMHERLRRNCIVLQTSKQSLHRLTRDDNPIPGGLHLASHVQLILVEELCWCWACSCELESQESLVLRTRCMDNKCIAWLNISITMCLSIHGRALVPTGMIPAEKIVLRLCVSHSLEPLLVLIAFALCGKSNGLLPFQTHLSLFSSLTPLHEAATNWSHQKTNKHTRPVRWCGMQER